jgi:hypothetical protein
MSKRKKEFRFGWCASKNHDWCPHHLGKVVCTCWCHPRDEEVAA